jgi:hypothetical protein
MKLHITLNMAEQDMTIVVSVSLGAIFSTTLRRTLLEITKTVATC